MRKSNSILRKIYAISGIILIAILASVIWIEKSNIGMKGEIVHFDQVIESLEYDRDMNGLTMNKIVCLEKFAQTLYAENPIGVENIKFKYYLQDIKNADRGISDEEFEQAVRMLVETEEYIRNYDIRIMEYAGTDYANDRYDPERFGKSVEELNEQGYEYDYALLELYEEMFADIDRKRCLAGIFNKICEQEESNLERHKAVLQYCNKISVHSGGVLPVNKEGEVVTDPVILMELHEMQCGQVARMACDLFSAAGYQTRLVQLGGHIIAEIYYDDGWHYFDADLWNGDEVVESTGRIPSVEELSHQPYQIDTLANTGYEAYMWNINAITSISSYPSFFYFSEEAYGEFPCYYYKTATEQEELNWYYGWNYYETTKADIELSAEKYTQPGVPYIENVSVKVDGVVIEWGQFNGDISEVIGYRVFVSRTSRGWEYANINGEEEIASYVVDRYSPEQYDMIAQLPPAEVYDIDTENTEIELDLEKGIYYISIMPYDAHGFSIGREVYLLSNELKVEIG